MRKRIVLFTIIFAALLLISCGAGKTVSEAELQEDLKSKSSFIIHNDLQVSGLKIVKRQTTISDKVDKVWVKVDVSNGRFEGCVYYVMTYGLYNDGWLLDSIEDDNMVSWSFAPLCPLSEEDIRLYIPESASIKNIYTEMDIGRQTVLYSYTEPHSFCDIVYVEEISFVFGTGYNNAGMWSVSDTRDAGTYERWKVDGTWKYELLGENPLIIDLALDGFNPDDISYYHDTHNAFEVSVDYVFRFNPEGYLGTFDDQKSGLFKTSYFISNDDQGYVIFIDAGVYITITYDKFIFTHGGDFEMTPQWIKSVPIED